MPFVDTLHRSNPKQLGREVSPSKEPASHQNADGSLSDSMADIKVYESVEEFERNLPPTVTVLKHPSGGKVYLVGTAHFSVQSQDDVSLAIRNTNPDIVMVELCASRIHILKQDERTLLDDASDTSLAKIGAILKHHGLVNGIFYIVLLYGSAALTAELGMAPGGEFRRALAEVHRMENRRSILHLGDRPIDVTLQRALHGLSCWQTLKIVVQLLWCDEKISTANVEGCKQSDQLEKFMDQMGHEYPVLRDVFVSERDLYLSHSLQVAVEPQLDAAGEVRPVTVVGVVGIGHVSGIVAHWGQVDRARIDEISMVPEVSRTRRLARLMVKWGLVSAVGFGVYVVVKPRLSWQHFVEHLSSKLQ